MNGCCGAVLDGKAQLPEVRQDNIYIRFGMNPEGEMKHFE